MNEIKKRKLGLPDHVWRNPLLKNYSEKIQEATDHFGEPNISRKDGVKNSFSNISGEEQENSDWKEVEENRKERKTIFRLAMSESLRPN